MRIHEVRISGLRALPVAAQIAPIDGTRGRAVRIAWAAHAARFHLPTAATPRRPLLTAIIGANSAGKSTLLHALHLFFGPTSKLDPTLFHNKEVSAPVVVEVTLTGTPATVTAWHEAHCTRRDDAWQLTVAHVWQAGAPWARRTRYLRAADGSYHRQSPRDRAAVDKLLPQWRIIWADRELNQEANLERRSLLSDLIDALVAQAAGQDSVLGRMTALVGELEQLAARRSRDPAAPDADGWTPILALEEQLAQGLSAITPQPKQVRLRLEAGLPTLRTILAQSLLHIDDGVELALEHHGLGMQRALVVSILRAWSDAVRHDTQDYLFAIEEPEIYLHPHANRVLLNLLEEIAGHDQVLYTTHASEFVNRTPLNQVITVYRDQVGSRVVQPRLGRLSADALVKVQRYLQEDRSDMLFSRAVVLVEGQAEYFALPAFARTLGLDLDRLGVSVAFVNGIGNFPVYHQILRAFAIPHVIIMDGDGQQAARQRAHADLADAVFVLPQDFEAQLVQALTPTRLLALMNECLARRGRPPRTALGDPQRRSDDLAALSKPLVGRVAGELLSAEEVRRMPLLVNALQQAGRLAFGAPASPR